MGKVFQFNCDYVSFFLLCIVILERLRLLIIDEIALPVILKGQIFFRHSKIILLSHFFKVLILWDVRQSALGENLSFGYTFRINSKIRLDINWISQVLLALLRLQLRDSKVLGITLHIFSLVYKINFYLMIDRLFVLFEILLAIDKIKEGQFFLVFLKWVFRIQDVVL